jgi:hypothetical protein
MFFLSEAGNLTKVATCDRGYRHSGRAKKRPKRLGGRPPQSASLVTPNGRDGETSISSYNVFPCYVLNSATE